MIKILVSVGVGVAIGFKGFPVSKGFNNIHGGLIC
jgi:hypothetical protein